MASVIVNPIFQVHSAGIPVSGGKVHTYECGTTTNKTTYTDYAEGTANANPVILDSNGQADIYCSGCLKVVITDSDDVTLDTIDNVQGFDGTILQDADRDTKIQVEESADEDIIRFDIAGTQQAYIDSSGWHGNVIFDQAKGDLRRPDFSWKDADEIYIDAGAYDHNGTTQQFVYWSSQLTFQSGPSGSNSDNATLGNSTWYYLYLDDSAIVTQGSPLLDADCFLLSATAPTWNGSKFGYYNGNDRCIFAVITDGSAQIDPFWHNFDHVAFDTYCVDRSTADLDSTWTSVILTIPSFSKKAQVAFRMTTATNAAETYGLWRTTGSSNATGHNAAVISLGADDAENTVDVITDSSQTIDVRTNRDDNEQLGVYTEGWYFPNGM